MKGKFVIQAKHTSNLAGSCSSPEFARLIKAEHAKIKKLIADGEIENYLVFTNRKKPADKTIKCEKDLKKLGLKHAQVFGDEQLRLWLTAHPQIWRSLAFDRFERKFEIQPVDLTNVIVEFHDRVKAKPTTKSKVGKFPFQPKAKKNKINKLSKGYFSIIESDSLRHFKAIEDFLKNPRNEAYKALYEDTADEIKRKITAHSSDFESFDEALTYVIDLIVVGNEQLKSLRRYVGPFLHYMYYHCDIGQHDSSYQTS